MLQFLLSSNCVLPFYFPILPITCSPDSLCTKSEVFGLISLLPSSTASGPLMSSQMLKSTCISIVAPLTHLFNLSLPQGCVPADWKTCFIVPIPKCSSNLDNPSNYRPISLLSIISKLLEKHLHFLLYKFCLEYNLISTTTFQLALNW